MNIKKLKISLKNFEDKKDTEIKLWNELYFTFPKLAYIIWSERKKCYFTKKI